MGCRGKRLYTSLFALKGRSINFARQGENKVLARKKTFHPFQWWCTKWVNWDGEFWWKRLSFLDFHSPTFEPFMTPPPSELSPTFQCEVTPTEHGYSAIGTLILPNRNTFESLEKCRFVHRAISSGVETLARRPSRTTARSVERGTDFLPLCSSTALMSKRWQNGRITGNKY